MWSRVFVDLDGVETRAATREELLDEVSYATILSKAQMTPEGKVDKPSERRAMALRLLPMCWPTEPSMAPRAVDVEGIAAVQPVSFFCPVVTGVEAQGECVNITPKDYTPEELKSI